MKFDSIDKSMKKRFLVEASGIYSTEEYFNLLSGLLQDEQWKTGMDVLIDFRNVSFENASLHDVFKVAEFAKIVDKDFAPNKCAFVMPSRSFMLGMYYKFLATSSLNMKTEIFKQDSYEKALSWMNE